MKSSNLYFKRLGYGKFPYLIIREQSGMYRQIPIHFRLKDPEVQEGVIIHVDDCESYETIESKCDEVLIRILTKKTVLLNQRMNYQHGFIIPDRKLTGCVVFGPGDVIYRSLNGERINTSTSIPWGGTLLTLCDERIEFENGNHYSLGE